MNAVARMNAVRLAAAVIGAWLAAGSADAALVRSGGSTSNNGQGGDLDVYVTTTDTSIHIDSSPQQTWISNPAFLPVPMYTDGSFSANANNELCFHRIDGIYCSYSIGPGESQALAVTASSYYGSSIGFPNQFQVAPTLTITWRVVGANGEVRRFVFSDQPYGGASLYPFTLNMTGIPAGTYTLEVDFSFALPDGYAFYWSSAPYSGDIRDAVPNYASGPASTYDFFSGTTLTIDKDSVPADSAAPVSSAALAPAPAGGWNNTAPVK